MSTLRVDNIVPYTSGSTTVVLSGTLDTTASYALTASYAMNGGGGGSTGLDTTASGDYSHAEGRYTLASGDFSHAEGNRTIASNNYAHAEGRYTTASRWQSHAEGNRTHAGGISSHAEGDRTIALGEGSHAEGYNTIASGSWSHAEGQYTKAIGGYSHAEGSQTIAGFKAVLITSISNGLITISDNIDYSSAFTSGKVVLNGNSVYTYNSTNFISPNFTIQLDDTTVNNGVYVYDIEQPASPLAGYNNNNGGQHAEGVSSYALGNSSHAEGYGTRAIGSYSHAEGQNTQAIGFNSHAAGYQTKAIGGGSQAIGGYSQAFGQQSNAEGNRTVTGYRGVQIDSCIDGLITISDNVDYSSIFGTGQDRLLIGSTAYSVDSIAYNAPDFTIQLSDRTLNTGGWIVDINYPDSPLAGYIFTNGGNNAHSEGIDTKALGYASHAEGANTIAAGDYSHAIGQFTKTTGYASQAIGGYSQALGTNSHAEGNGTLALGFASHTEGINTIAGYRNLKVTSIVDGLITISNDIDYSSYFNSGRIIYNEELYTYNSINFSSPDFTIQLDDTGINEGEVYIFNPDQPNAQLSGYSEKGGYGGHAEGLSTRALGQNSHAEGFGTKAIGGYSHAEGDQSQAIGEKSHAEGRLTIASGNFSHAEGNRTLATNTYAHAEGRYTTASRWHSHAEGNRTHAGGIGSHAEGYGTLTLGEGSHAEGQYATASGEYSHAEGLYTIAEGNYQHVQGQFNVTSSVQSAFIVGNGTDANNRSNLIYAAGNEVQISGSIYLGSGSIINESGSTLVLTPPTALSGQSLVIRPTAANLVSDHPFGFYSGDSITITFTPTGIATTGTGSYTFTGATEIQLGTPLTGSLLFDNQISQSLTWTVPALSDITGFTFDIYNFDMFVSNSISLSSSGSSEHSHVHLISGNPATTDIYLGDDDQYIKIEKNAGNVVIGTNLDTYHWIFNTSGSLSQGTGSVALGIASHAEGYYTTSSGDYSHAEGEYAQTIGVSSHAEGIYTQAIGDGSHAEGSNTQAIGERSHAEGESTLAIGYASHAEGSNTIASGSYQHVSGQYNQHNNTGSYFVVGIGLDNNNRKDGFTVDVDANGSGSVMIPNNVNTPSTAKTGSMYVDPTNNKLWIYTGNGGVGGWVTASLG